MSPEQLRLMVERSELSRLELESLYLTLHRARTGFLADLMRLRLKSPETMLPALRKAVVSFIRMSGVVQGTIERIGEHRSTADSR
jgi:hypothetical protein